MRNYVVGDIQGCYKGLRKLLVSAGFNPNKDKLWAVGDLVARGPQSLETLKFLKDLGPEHFDTVLGNHDLHLIAMAHGISTPKPVDKLDSLMKDKSFDDLIEWLCTKKLALKPAKKHFISHAGLYPMWSTKKALKLADEVSDALMGPERTKFLKNMYGNSPNVWSKNLKGPERLRFVVNAFTRMRFLNANALEFKTKCHPDAAPAELTPWYLCPNPKLKKNKVLLFGHWASLMGETHDEKIIALDTGFVWGKTMSLYCIESKSFFSQPA
ncbi:symmetrical bis(5'-nucleosyl)-tetraphosphatase [Glaciecola sp. MF2-115]|uniref:symmetrical bis(5'-nucleosyl)-tetraphosphatase n=1 Tax=Glaciecola sp. MF2-115 TaxID=3384827 RepID=UPI0039A24920